MPLPKSKKSEEHKNKLKLKRRREIRANLSGEQLTEIRTQNAQRKAKSNLSDDKSAELRAAWRRRKAKSRARLIDKLTEEELILHRAEISVKKTAANLARHNPPPNIPDARTRETLLEIRNLKMSVRALKKASIDIIKKSVQSAVGIFKDVPSESMKRSSERNRQRKFEKESTQSDGCTSQRELRLKKEGFACLSGERQLQQRSKKAQRERELVSQLSEEQLRVMRSKNAQRERERRARLSKDQLQLLRWKNAQSMRERKAKLTEEECLSQWRKPPKNREQPVKMEGLQKLPIVITNKDPTGNELFVCIVCNKESDKKHGIRTHYARYHTESEILSAKEKQESTETSSEQKGFEMIVRVYKCELCPEKVYSIPRYRRHLVTAHSENKEILKKLCFVCSICDETFTFKQHLMQHMKDFHEIFTQCPVCNENVKTEELFKQHVEEMHSDCGKKDEIVWIYTAGFFCKVCGFANKLHSAVLLHSENHSSGKSIQCNMCELKFDTKREFIRHKTKFHEERLFCCEVCGNRFTNMQDLGNHKQMHKTKQANEKIECKNCGKQFSSKTTYRVHFLAVHQNKKYQCTVCQKTFTYQTNLHIHKITVCEKEKATPRTCPICGKILDNYLLLFYHKSNFHKFGNTEENVCHVCNKTMKSPFDLYTHNKQSHRTDEEKKLKNSISMTCAVCEKSCPGPGKSGLLEHWRTHREERPYRCNLCDDLTFRYPYQFYAHRKKDHQSETKTAKIITDPEVIKNFMKDFNEAHAEQFLKRKRQINLKSANERRKISYSVNIADSRVTNASVNSNNPNGDCDKADYLKSMSDIGFDPNEKSCNSKVQEVTEVQKGLKEDFNKAHEMLYLSNLKHLGSAVETTNSQDSVIAEENLSVDHNGRKISICNLGFISEKSSEIEINNIDKTYVDFSRANIPVGRQTSQGVEEDIPKSDSECKNAKGDSATMQDNSVQENIGRSEFMESPDSFDPVDSPWPMDYSDSESITEDKKPLIFENINFHQDPFKNQLTVKIYKLKECLVCNQFFPTPNLYTSHINSKGHRAAVRESKKEAILITKSEKEKVTNRSHKRKSDGKTVKKESVVVLSCLFCNEKFSNANKYSRHIALHKIRANCLLCAEKFPTVRKLIDHYISEHSGENIIKCEICDKGFLESNERSLRDHIKFQHDKHKRKRIRPAVNFTCDICGAVIAGCKSFNAHLLSHGNDKHNCVHCTEKLTGLVALESHYNETHNGEMPFPCDECSQSFPVQHRLQLHEKVMHRKMRKDNCNQKVKDRNYSCDKCSKTFTSLSALSAHDITHDPVEERRKYSCDFCGKSFLNTTSLKYHRREHTGEKPYPCTFCELSFISAKLLQQHIDTVHETKGHTCDVCGKSFDRRKYLVQHLRVHKSDRESTCMFACQLCPERFKKSDALTRHLQTLHDPNRPFGCDQCSCRFLYPGNLQVHKKGVHEKLNNVYPKNDV